ncbi:MAG TPA: WecB/TagA/CpsF family glycosyltransferase [Acidimicrobiales bacterium]|nr:WecB/TagA/CpsF family glycosyltransferase [Acidimicrobiales bacterium]
MDVLGVGISATSLPAAVATVAGWIERKERRYVCVTGVHGVMESQEDPELMAIHNQSGLTVPDGAPMVWAGRAAGATGMGRVRGPDLMVALCRLAATQGWTSYFYGGAPDTPHLLADRLRSRFPGLEVVGCMSPPFRPLTEQENSDFVGQINAAGPDLVWVGLSTPKQERWMAENIDRLEASALLGVGAAFDIHAGLVPEPPRWIQSSGFEWLYRLSRDPGRLWKRYARHNPRFVARMVRQQPFLRP